MTTHLPEFSSNSAGEPPRTVGGDLSAVLSSISDSGALAAPPPFDIATAYFNLGGYEVIADALDTVGPVRLLLGAEPTDAQVRATIQPLGARPARKKNPQVQEAIARHDAALAEDRDLVGFGSETDSAVERLIDFLRRGDVEVRRLESGFLHGKAYLLTAVSGSALAGSSNLTYAGLARNRELNVGVHQPGVVSEVRSWFDEQWGQAVPYDLAALYEDRRVPHDASHVFLRMLLALYGDEVGENPVIDNELGLAPHQLDGVHRARRILHRRNGVIVADEVGLGKTYIAGELIREAAIERRQKVLVVAPATLRDTTWVPFLKEKNLPAHVVSFEQLVADLDAVDAGGEVPHKYEDCALVVVDEAHHIRNGNTERATAMRLLLGGSVAKDLVLLSATPVNNSLKDLHTLLGYIDASDAAFADVGVASLDGYFKRAMAIDPDELSGEHLFDVLDAVAVRRTRRFIQKEYPHATMPNGKPIVFPQAVVHRSDYALGGVLPDFFPRFAEALGAGLDPDAPAPDGTYLTMARYVPSRYDNDPDNEEQYQVQNAGLLQSALLKRFESSAAAFVSTLRVMMKSHDEFLAGLDAGWVLTGDALRDWVATDSDDVAEFIAELDEDDSENVRSADRFDVDRLRNDVVADRALLQSFADEVSQIDAGNDPKVDTLVEELAAIAAEARTSGVGDEDTRNRRKVLVFTYFADTAQYLESALKARIAKDPRLGDYADRVTIATGSDKGSRHDAVVGFAPKTVAPYDETAQDKYDLLIATDVLSEGVNLQQAGHIINYDLPWNPMRLVQRHGRVDRIGSQHSHIHLRCFFPDTELEELLELEQRLQLKLKHAAAAFGVDEVLPGTTPVEVVLTENREEIEKLRREDAALFDPERGASASSEEFQRRLARALDNEVTAGAVRGLPWGAGAGLSKPGARCGVVFCMQVADFERPFFRFVPLNRGADGSYAVNLVDEEQAEVIDSLLACLTAADPEMPGANVEFDSAMHKAVFDAWPVARQSVMDEWTFQTDPANLQPKLPKVMHDAMAMIRAHGGDLGDRQERLAQRFGQVLERRHLALVREAVNEGKENPLAGVVALQKVANLLRLQVPQVIEAKLPAEPGDVRVIAWMAIAGKEDENS